MSPYYIYVAKQVQRLNPAAAGKAQAQVDKAVATGASDRGAVVANVSLPTSRLPEHEKS